MTRSISNAAFIQSNPAGKDLKTSNKLPLSAEGIKTAPAPEARDDYNQSIRNDIADIKAERNAAGISEKETSDVKTTTGLSTAAAGFTTGYVIGEITYNMEKAEIEKTAKKEWEGSKKK